jgi:hypothetical protein|tara:strand:- start:309 stop:506 length:198 start_codon:yes stop_codon:yes gene_type:complete
MKLKIQNLREIVRRVVSEAAKEGAIQKVYRRSYKNMVRKASTGGNKNTPPFSQKATVGKSGVSGD